MRNQIFRIKTLTGMAAIALFLFSSAPAPVFSMAALKPSCSISENGDMVCDKTGGNPVKPKTLNTDDPLKPKKDDTAETATGDGRIVGNVASCDKDASTSRVAAVDTRPDGTVTVTTSDSHGFNTGADVTIAGGGALDGKHKVAKIDDHTFTFKTEDGKALAGIPGIGAMTATGDRSSAGIQPVGCEDTPESEQSKIDGLTKQLQDLKNLYNQLESQMNSLSLEDQQKLANQMAQAAGGSSTPTSGGNPMDMLKNMLGNATKNSGIGIPGNALTGNNAMNAAQNKAVTDGQKENYSPNSKKPGDSGQVCNFDSKAVDPEKSLRSIDNQIGTRYCVGGKKSAEGGSSTNVVLIFSCEGVNKTMQGQLNGTGNGEVTLAKAELQKTLDIAKKINEELKKPLTKEDAEQCSCKDDKHKEGSPSAVKSDPKNCFTTVLATAAFREGESLGEKLKQAIGKAKCGDFTEAGQKAKEALGGKLGDDGDAAFKSLAADNSPGDGNLKDQRKKFADEVANTPGLAERLCGRQYTEDHIIMSGANRGKDCPECRQAVMEETMNRALARGQSLSLAISKASGYFPVKDGNPSRAVTPACKAAIDNALNGSNICNFCTGNASEDVGFGYHHGADDPKTYTSPSGERYGIENKNSDLNWAKGAKENANKPSGGQCAAGK
jgi:hypothetical protein